MSTERHKVVLYNPRSVFFDMPLALLAVGSCLDPEDYDVQIIDGRVRDDAHEAVLSACKGALCFGLTALTGKPLRDAVDISRKVKQAFPDLPVVWGGWHPSIFPAQTLEDEASIDVTVQGQGEETFAMLVEAFRQKQSLDGLQGICCRKDGKVIPGQPRPMADMNSLAPARYDLVDVPEYYSFKGKRQLDYISSTGCLFRCAFCADPFVYKRKYTAIEPERMGDELESLWHRHPFDDINFQDETFFTYRKRVLAIAEEFIRRKLPVTWAGTMRANQGCQLEEEDFQLLKRSGLRRVLIGVESGTQEMMDYLMKDIKLEQVIEAAERCRRHGIGGIFPFIVGFPGESDESVEASLELAGRLSAMSPDFSTPFFYFKPYPGSHITQAVVAEGYKLPDSLEAWASFDYVGSASEWVSPAKYRRVEAFKFYNHLAWSRVRRRNVLFQKVARARCERRFFSFPFEKLLADRFRPAAPLS